MRGKQTARNQQWRNELYQLCVGRKWEQPRYRIRSIGNDAAPKFSVVCRVFADGFVFESRVCKARRKKVACQQAAQDVLMILRRYFTEKSSRGESDFLYQDDPLTIRAFHMDMDLPTYSYSGPYGAITASGTFSFKGQCVRAQGSGMTKQAARTAASEALMKQLPFF
jgi:hypothetical protein